MRPRRLRLHARRVGTIIIRVRTFTAIRRVRIMLVELGLLGGTHVRPHRVRRLVRPFVRRPVRLRAPRLVRPAVAGVVVAAAADAGEV